MTVGMCRCVGCLLVASKLKKRLSVYPCCPVTGNQNATFHATVHPKDVEVDTVPVQFNACMQCCV